MLIEDRISRMEKYNSSIVNISQVDIFTGNNFEVLINSLKNNDTTSIDNYACIAAHRTALPDKIRESLKDYCKMKNKPLIFFSGGISASVLKDNPFPFLNLNSKDFYSDNFNLFCVALKNLGIPNLLILQFGVKWKLSLLLNLRNLISVHMNRRVLVNESIDGFENKKLVDELSMVRDLQLSNLLIKDLISENDSLVFLKNQYESIDEDKLKILKRSVDNLIFNSI